MKRLFFILIMWASVLSAQDTIRFRNGEAKAVKVQEVGLKEIKYNRFDNLTGPIYVCTKEEVSYIRYSNGSVDSFTITPQKTENANNDFKNYEGVHPVPQPETPGYVNSSPVPEAAQSEKINIAGKRLYYHHRGVSDKQLLSMIKDHPDAATRSFMLREYSKIPVYKNNRMIGVFLYAGGIAATFGALVAGSTPVLVIGSAAIITGCIMATMNKNKRYSKRVQIAKIYNGDIAFDQ